MKKKFNTRTLVLTALLIALQIVFVRLLPIGAGSIRISLGFLPVAVAGMVLGPVGGGIMAVIADIVGMLLFSRGDVYFPLFTLTEFLYGVGFGLLLHKKELSYIKLSIFTLIQFIFLNLVLNSLWLYFYYIMIVSKPQGFWVILTGRTMAAMVNLPMQLIGVNVVKKYIKKPLEKMYK